MTNAMKDLKAALEAKIGKRTVKVGGAFIAEPSEGATLESRRYTIAQARKLTGMKAPERNFSPRMSAWGDWATVAMMNGGK